MSGHPGWPVIALGTACGFLLGIVVALVLGDAGSTGATTATVAGPATTVTVAATRTTGGTVIVSTGVPAVVGERLDTAKARLQRSRFDVDVDGGGLLGVIRDANWEVVAQTPRAGANLEQGSSVRVRIKRR